MYEKDGERYFIVDGHVHFRKPSDTGFRRQSEETILYDLFDTGFVDHAICQPADAEGEVAASALAERHPERFSVAGLEPVEGRPGLKGVKLITSEQGRQLSDPCSYRFLERCQELGIRNVHLHADPAVRLLDAEDRDGSSSFDAAGLDEVAAAFPDLRFIVEHVGLARLQDFCWIATQEPNVYAGLALALPFIHTRPRAFAEIVGELLYWMDENRITFASDYGLQGPRELVESFVDFEMPEDFHDEYGELTAATKKKILGLNTARLYGLAVPEDLVVADAPAESHEIASGSKVPV
ncbi:amidohydrolase family protein [Amycolatopsis rhabdoformis]|uniref:Amidohydrolase family protein n=1 Tax=Amycolatopsis rhabdoformis TaxID=1448059 RepID=A0ABZ1I2M7_9PSEU|nr:amidohydrolase family protein [Amycolatopsis rhabdoformis]WSE28191.1 amidohydrolase family protein [Amycolatopsis rhabdoformis]